MGYTNSQIAAQLLLADSTVKNYLSSAFRKLGVRSRSEAVSLILGQSADWAWASWGLGGEARPADVRRDAVGLLYEYAG